MDTSEKSLVSSAPLRTALSSAFEGAEFGLGNKADAAEAMVGMLTTLHTVLAKPDSCSKGDQHCRCAVHQTLAVAASHHVVCPASQKLDDGIFAPVSILSRCWAPKMVRGDASPGELDRVVWRDQKLLRSARSASISARGGHAE